MPKKQWVQKTKMVYKKVPVEDRFFSKAVVLGCDECWMWTAGTRKTSTGFVYGQFSLNGYPEWAHRASYIITYGEIPDGLQVCHKCDVPLCVNPAHLFLGTQKHNMQDMLMKGRDAIVGMRNHSAKFDDVTVVLARKMYDEGCSLSTISRVFGVHRQTVKDAVSNITWKHIGGSK